MSIIQLALLALAALAVIVIIILFVSKRKRDDVPTETSMDSVEDDTPLRRRPDLRVNYGDPARQKTEVDDGAGGSGGTPLVVGAAQIIGQREDQEDAYGFSQWNQMDVLNAKGFLAVMADGIGGLSDGQLASQAAVAGAMEVFSMQSSEEDPAARVLDITAAAQRSVLMQNSKVNSDSGSTFLCVLIDDLELNLASVGDSRIALYRSGVLLQLNREHVLGREIDEKNALLGDRRVENAQRRKAITAFLGKDELRTIDRTLHPMQLVSGDRILLMSDGVFNTLSDNAIVAYLNLEPQAAAEAIVRAVEEKKVPGQDNATIVIVGVK